MEQKDRGMEGNAHIFIVGLLFLLITAVTLSYLYWEKVSNSSYEQIDTAVTGSLLSALIPDIEKSYASTTGKGLMISSTDFMPYSQVGQTEHDAQLARCYDRFLSSLKINLGLNEKMESTNPMICGSVKIKYLRLYEVKKLNTGGFRVTQHLYQNGRWIVERILEGGSMPGIEVFSTWDGERRKITRTSLETELEICLLMRPNGKKLIEQGTLIENAAVQVNYVRVAEVTDEQIENW